MDKYKEICERLEHLPFTLEFGNTRHLQLVQTVARMKETYFKIIKSRARNKTQAEKKLDNLIKLVESFLIKDNV